MITLWFLEWPHLHSLLLQKMILIEIYRYGTLNYGQEQAELYVHGIKDKCQLVADTPELCRERKEFKPPVRIYNYKSHLIIYLLKEEFILVVRILHARMDLVSETGWAKR